MSGLQELEAAKRTARVERDEMDSLRKRQDASEDRLTLLERNNDEFAIIVGAPHLRIGANRDPGAQLPDRRTHA
jgi:hypothetical protein